MKLKRCFNSLFMLSLALTPIPSFAQSENRIVSINEEKED